MILKKLAAVFAFVLTLMPFALQGAEPRGGDGIPLFENRDTITLGDVEALNQQLLNVRAPLLDKVTFSDPDYKSRFTDYVSGNHTVRALLKATRLNLEEGGRKERVENFLGAFNQYMESESHFFDRVEYLVTIISANSITKRVAQLEKALTRYGENEKDYREFFGNYNERYKVFLKMTAQLCSGQGLSEKASQSAKYPNNYTFDDVLLCSGLRAYIRTGGGVGLNGVTLNKTSVLDNYNKAVRNEILAENESFFLEIKKVSDSVFSDYKVRRTAARKLSGYNEIKGIVEADGKIFENIDDMLERGLNAIKELRDPAKTPLRFNVDLAPEAFANTPGGDATGPRYVLNLRTSVSNLLAKWGTAASYLDGRHGDDPDWKKMRLN